MGLRLIAQAKKLYLKEAKEGVLRLCTVAMSKVALNAGSKSSIVIARASDGTLWSGWSATPRKAKIAVLASCKKAKVSDAFMRRISQENLIGMRQVPCLW